MQAGERLIEAATAQVEREAAAGIAKIRAELERPGRLVCACGEEISNARRQAMPGARGCIDCATRLEQQRRRA